MKTRLSSDTPEYALGLEWGFDRKERSLKLVVADSGRQVRVIYQNTPVEDVDPYKDGELDYEGVHQIIGEFLFSKLESDFSRLRLTSEREIPAPVLA